MSLDRVSVADVSRIMALNYDVLVNYLVPLIGQMRDQRGGGLIAHTNSLAGLIGLPPSRPLLGGEGRGADAPRRGACRAGATEYPVHLDPPRFRRHRQDQWRRAAQALPDQPKAKSERHAMSYGPWRGNRRRRTSPGAPRRWSARCVFCPRRSPHSCSGSRPPARGVSKVLCGAEPSKHPWAAGRQARPSSSANFSSRSARNFSVFGTIPAIVLTVVPAGAGPDPPSMNSAASGM